MSVPSLLLAFTGAQASYPSDIEAMRQALGADDLTVDAVAGAHFGGPIRAGAPTGNSLASPVIERWLRERF